MSHLQATPSHGHSHGGAPNPVGGDDDGIAVEAAGAGEERASAGLHSKHWYRVALVFTIILIVSVVFALPFAVSSMVATLFGAADEIVYDLKSGRAMSIAETEGNETDRTYINIAMDDITEGAASASMTVSGHRECTGNCPELDLLILALDDAAGRKGMAPSAELQVLEAIDIFTEPIDLPIAGNPSLYPFDDYTIQLAIAGYSLNATATRTALTEENFADNLTISVQDQVSEFVMQPPISIELPEVDDQDDLLEAVAGQQLEFHRPLYLKVLTGLLVLLIGISGALALFTRSIDDLLLGIGGLILGVWGIRSVMVPQPLPTLSVVDISLSGVILCLLIGLAVRTAIHFHQKSELNMLQRLRRR